MLGIPGIEQNALLYHLNDVARPRTGVEMADLMFDMYNDDYDNWLAELESSFDVPL